MEQLSNINWAVLAPIFIIEMILIIVALVDLIRIERTRGPKWLWALIILFVQMFGPILYFIIGRRSN